MSGVWLRQTPPWIWWSLVPIFGGLAIAYAGVRVKSPGWLGLGLVVATIAISSASSVWMPIMWLVQVGFALGLRRSFLVKTCPKSQLIAPDVPTAKLIAAHRGRVNLNTCSKDDLVYHLGLPIVYANKIDRLRRDGFVFRNLQQLQTYAELPASYLPKLSPLIVWERDQTITDDLDWQCLNTFSVDELVLCGMQSNVAKVIVAERDRNGYYQSLQQVKERTGIALGEYAKLFA